MAIKNWTGTTDKTWSVVSNWDTGTAPANNDDIYISSGPSIDGGAYGSTDLDSLTIGPEYTGRIGSEGTPLTVAADQLLISGGGDICITAGAAGIDQAIINTPHTSSKQTIRLAGTITDLFVLSGYVKLTGGTVSNLYVEGSAHVVIDGADVTTIFGNRGNVDVINSASQVTTLYNRAASIQVDDGGITSIWNLGAGKVVYDSTSSITLLRAMDGTFSRADNRQLTITTAYIHSSAKADLRHRGVTISTAYQVGPAVANYMPLGTATMEI